MHTYQGDFRVPDWLKDHTWPVMNFDMVLPIQARIQGGGPAGLAPLLRQKKKKEGKKGKERKEKEKGKEKERHKETKMS